MLNDIGMKCSLKNFSKIVLVLTSQHNVHQVHIIQVLLIMILMVFEEKLEKCDLLVLLRVLFKIVLHQQKTQHNLMKYQIVIYNYTVHVFMHVPQLTLISFNVNVNYDLAVLKMNKNCVIIAHSYIKFWFDIKKRKQKENNKKIVEKEVVSPQAVATQYPWYSVI